MRIPRKLKKKIPKNTDYCYKATSGIIYEEGDSSTPLGKLKKLPYFKIKPCHFYLDEKGLFGKCSLLKCEVIDQCKECSIGYPKY